MDTVLGNVWHLLNPVLLIGVYFLIFDVILNVSRGVDNFLVFLTVGIVIFTYTQRAAVAGAASIVNNEGLIRSIEFPRAVLPISSVVEQTLAFLPEILVMLAVAVATGEDPALAWFLLLPLAAVQSLFNLGLAFSLARLTNHVRDIVNVLPYLFRVWFYLSGALFPVREFVHDPTLLTLFDLNPMFALIEIARDLVFGQVVPNRLWLVVLGWSVGLLVIGFLYFRSAEHEYGRR